MKAWQDEHDLIEKDILKYITNPLNAFALIKRATSDITLLEQRFPAQLTQFLENIKEIRPNSDDLEGAVTGLLRLQFIYKLKSVDFANGIIDGIETRQPFSAHDLFIIGEEASRIEGQEYFAVEYLGMSLNLVNAGHDVDKEVDENVLLTYLASCYNKTGNFEVSIDYTNVLIEKNPDMPEYTVIKKQLEEDNLNFGYTRWSMFDPFSDFYVKDGSFQVYKEDIIYSQVCRGNLTQSPAELSKLHCRYVSNNPFTKLARFKVEEINSEPYIVLFIDILSDMEIYFLTNEAKTKVERAMVNPNGAPGAKSNNRVAQNAWFYDYEHEIYARISQRIDVSLQNYWIMILILHK